MVEAVGIGLVLILNLVAFVLTYGKLQQKVEDLDKSLDEVKANLSTINAELGIVGQRLARIEGKLFSS